MKHAQVRRDTAVVLSVWLAGLLTFVFVNYAPTTIRATAVGMLLATGGVWATRYYLTRPPRSHPVVFNNGALRVQAVIVNSPYDEDETQRRVAGIAHTLVACISRAKSLPREATRALKSINDALPMSLGHVAKTQSPFVVNVPGSNEGCAAFGPGFNVIDEDDRAAMEVEDFEETFDETLDETVADNSGKCTTCDHDAEVLFEWESDDGPSIRHVYCRTCAELVQHAVESTADQAVAG